MTIKHKPILNKCKICNSIHTPQVNDMLEKNVPQTVVVAYLKDKGLILSAMSVSRHLHNCLLKDGKKQRQVQKGGIRNAQAQAKHNTKKGKDVKLRSNQKNMNRTDTNHARDTNGARKRRAYIAELEKLEKDVDVVNEYVFILKASKERVARGLVEEDTANLVLATTGKALSDYGALLQKFNEITQGMESLQSLRFAELIQMVGNMFAKTPITDRSRNELLNVVDQYITNTKMTEEMEEISLIPSEIRKSKLNKKPSVLL